MLTNEVIQKLQSGSSEAEAVTGLIFSVDASMTAQSIYSSPQIMSEATSADSEKLKRYAFNMVESQSLHWYHARYEHFFINNCDVLEALVPSYFLLAGFWLAIAIVFTAHLYLCTPSHSRLNLQKSLILLPIIKAVEVILEGLWLDHCPWVSTTSSYQYVQMARISIVTICYTTLIAIFYLLSKGWQLCEQQLYRKEANRLMLIMGFVYCTYSAFFLSRDFELVQKFFSICIGLIYLGLAYSFTMSNLDNAKKVRSHQENNIILQEAIFLKMHIIRWVTWAALGFCLTKVCDFALVNLLIDKTSKAHAHCIL